MTVQLTNTDNDTAGVTVSERAVSVDEAGGTATYTVRLASQPSGAVTVTPTSDAATNATVSTASGTGVLTFTTIDWATPQPITVTGVNDDIVNAVARTATISHAVSGGGYDSVSADPVTVTVTDDDTVGTEYSVMVSASAVSVDEDGGTAEYTVVLTSQPSGDVTVTPTSDATANATVSTASGTGVLTFTTINWATPQDIMVTGVDDDIDNTGNERQATISHAVSGGGYDTTGAASVAVSLIDDDTAGGEYGVTAGAEYGVVVSERAVSVDEAGGTQTYSIKLTGQPTGDVTVTPTSNATANATVSTGTVSGSLTFTSTNWATEQFVTVTGVDDDIDNAGNERQATISHAVSGGGYDNVSADPVTVTVNDDDEYGTVTLVVESEDAGTVRFQSASDALNVSVTVSNGTSMSEEILVPVGEHKVDYVLPPGFSASNASCSPDRNSVDRRAKSMSIFVEPGAMVTCTLLVEDAATRTVEEITNFMEERARLIQTHRSDRHRRIARLKEERSSASLNIEGHTVPGQFTMPLSLALDSTEGAEKAKMRFSCTLGTSSPSPASGDTGARPDCNLYDLWMEGTVGRYTSNDAKGAYAVMHGGIDRRVGQNVLVGLAVQHDRVVREGKGDRPGATFRSDGWMAGPYITARLHDSLYLDAGINAGTAVNHITMPGKGSAGTFNSQRFGGYATLLGDFDHGRWNVRPQLGFGWFEETSQAWTDGDGIRIPKVRVRQGDLEAGIRFTHTMPDEESSQYIEVEGLLPFGIDDDRESHLRLRLGATMVDPFFGGVLDASASFDGLGDGDWQSYAARFGYSVSPYWLPGAIDVGFAFDGTGTEALDFQGLTFGFQSVPDRWLGGIFTTDFLFDDASETDNGSFSADFGYKAKF